MTWYTWFLLWGLTLAFIYLFVTALRNYLLRKKAILQRNRLYDIYSTWTAPFQHRSLANDEFIEVSFEEHLKALKKGKNPWVLYGPICQALWKGNIYSDLAHPHWWTVYQQIYLNLDPMRQNIIRQHAWQMGMLNAFRYFKIDIDSFLEHADQKSVSVMADGAAEYEEAIAAQELMQ